MNKKFQRALSSALAFVMMCSCMMVANVSSVMAATKTYEYIFTPEVNTDNYFTATTSKNTVGTFPTGYDTDGYTITRADGTSTIITEALKMNSSGQVAFTLSSGSTADVTIIVSSKNKSTSKYAIGVKKDGADVAELKQTFTAEGFQTINFSLTEAGTYTIYRASTESNLYYVRVDETFSSSAQTYTISGTCNLANTTFAIGDMDATVDADGNWIASVTSGTAPFAVGDSLAVSKQGYSSNPTSVTLATGTDATSFDGGLIEFNEIPLDAIPAGTYDHSAIDAGKPNFDTSALSTTGAGKYKGTIKFILSETATVTVNGKCGSSTAGKLATVAIGDKSYTSNAGDAANDYVFSNVAAGETSLVLDDGNTSTTFQITSINITYGATSPIVQTTTGGDNSVVAVYKDTEKVYYAVSVIKAADVDTTSAVVLTQEGTEVGTTAEVYNGVQFGSTTYTAADFGGASGDYVYAFKVDASDSSDDDATVLGKVKKIVATLSPVTVQQ